MPKTLFDKVWDAHLVRPETPETPGVLYIDLHLVHEVTSPQAFSEIEARGLKVRRPDRTYATLDHSTPTLPAGLNGLKPYVTAQAEAQVHTLERNCAAHGVPIVPQGGNSGMAGGATPDKTGTAIILSLRRMNAIRKLTAEAAQQIGCRQLTLLEEPQAALYSWLQASDGRWRKEVRPGDVLLVEQYLDFAWAFAERYYVLQRGVIVESGHTARTPQADVQRYMSV